MPDFETLEDRTYNALQLRMKAYERQVNASLVDSLDQIRVDMSKIYERYAVDGKLSYADMARYNRLSTMQKSTIASLDEATRANIRTFNKLRPDLYNESFYRHAWAIDQDAGVRLAWGVVNKDAVLETLASEYYRISLDTYGAEARATVRRAMNDGLRQGKSYTKMMRDMSKALGTTSARAMRIVRTEGQTAMNAGQQDLYTRAGEKGIEGREIWDSTLDGRTRPSDKWQRRSGFNHRIMDGKAKQDDGLFHFPGGVDEPAPFPVWQGLKPGNRISCRCRARFQIDEYPPQVRRSREGGVEPYQTYPEWEKNLNSRGRSVPKVRQPRTTTPKPITPRTPTPRTTTPPRTPTMADSFNSDDQQINKLMEVSFSNSPQGLQRKISQSSISDIAYNGNKTSYFQPTKSGGRIRFNDTVRFGNERSLGIARHEFGHKMHIDLARNNPRLQTELFDAMRSETGKLSRRSAIGKANFDRVTHGIRSAGIGDPSDLISFKADGAVNDYFASITNNRIGFGHSNAYWKSGMSINGVNTAQVEESFAQMVSIYGRKDRTWWNYLEKETPELTGVFKKWIGS